MSAPLGFSVARWWSIVCKEFLQLRRDRVTFAMIVAVPLVQLTLFGFAINTDPKHMPTAVLMHDDSEFTRSFTAAMQHSGYFRFTETLTSEEAGRAALAQGRVQFVLNIPTDFTRRLLRGERPALLVEADATDPMAMASALGALPAIAQSVTQKDLTGPLASLGGSGSSSASSASSASTGNAPFDVQVHRLYNAEGITQYNIIPGLMGVILTMTLAMMTGLAIVRERERGTMENLLATPVLPIEVMTGKIVPYIAIGLIQASIILIAARFVFHVPFEGSVIAIYLSALVFIAANLTVGIALSSFAQNQLQAMQLTVFYFLPNMLLSGFMFPFRGMPAWAQAIGNVLPLTYFNRLIRGILLKGNGWADAWHDLWPLLVFCAVLMTVAVKFYKRTLD
ncbi:ABC transporter permease [Pandoraea sputorum]|uniref:ABC transporter permease n=1 Tax=Pandoraea sputorum TaxID=93222 RepID=UPI002B2EE00F|nr:ABC transporter permease [Pandoraea sputorum]